MNPVSGNDFYVLVFNSMLSGATVSSGISAVTKIAMGILVASFLLSVYGAFVNGANLAGFGRSLIKFIVVGAILSQWTTFFNELVSSSSTLATSIFTVGSGASDIYQSYASNLSTYIQSNQGIEQSVTAALSQGAAAALQLAALFIALCIYYLGMLAFAFWYSVWGLLLYMLGPLFIAAYPSGASAPYAKSYGKALVQWCLWPILYHILGSLISSSNMLTISSTGTMTPSSTWSSIEGTGATVAASIVGPFFTAAVTIVFAIMLLLLPFIADHLVSLNFGAVGEAVMGAVRTAAGIGVAGVAGAAAGAGSGTAGAGKAGGASATAGAGSSAVTTGGAGAGISPPPPTSAGASGGGKVSPPPASGGGVGGFVAGVVKGVGRAALGRQGAFVAGGGVRPPAPSAPPPAASTDNDE